MNQARFVVKPGAPGSPPRIERAVRWRLLGYAESEPTAEEMYDDLMFDLRDKGVGPEPILSYSTDDKGERVMRIEWPDLGTHALDPEYARLLALASLPLFREVPELDSQPERDPALEAEIERVVAEDRARLALVTKLGMAIGEAIAWHRRVERRVSRGKKRMSPRESGALRGSSTPSQAPPPEILVGERTASGWRWTRRSGSRLRLRGRLRR